MRVKSKHRFLKHLKSIGFSNRLSLYIILFLLIGLIGGFILAWKSIDTNYMGALACWTVVFTPLSTVISVAIGKVVDKSKAENTNGGIKFELAKTDNVENDATISEDDIISDEEQSQINSPEI